MTKTKEKVVTTTKTHARRLLKLAKFLKTIPDEKFDIGIWKTERKCGTVCCAVGWATNIPEFNRLGLISIKHNFDVFDYRIQFRPKNKSEDARIKRLKRVSDDFGFMVGDGGYEAGMMFFGLNDEQFTRLFMPEGYTKKGKILGCMNPLVDSKYVVPDPTPKRVAQKIVRYVRKLYPDLR